MKHDKCPECSGKLRTKVETEDELSISRSLIAGAAVGGFLPQYDETHYRTESCEDCSYTSRKEVRAPIKNLSITSSEDEDLRRQKIASGVLAAGFAAAIIGTLIYTEGYLGPKQQRIHEERINQLAICNVSEKYTLPLQFPRNAHPAQLDRRVQLLQEETRALREMKRQDFDKQYQRRINPRNRGR